MSETDPIISHHGGSSSPSGEIPDTIRWMEERNCYERIIKNNIDYDIIVEQYGKVWLDEIVMLMFISSRVNISDRTFPLR